MAMRPGFPGSTPSISGDPRGMRTAAAPSPADPAARAMSALRPQTVHAPGGTLYGDGREMVAGRPAPAPMSGTPPWMGGGFAPRAYTPTQNLQMADPAGDAAMDKGSALGSSGLTLPGNDFDPYAKQDAYGSSGLGLPAPTDMVAKQGAMGGMAPGMSPVGPAPVGPGSVPGPGRAQLAQLLARQGQR